MSFPEIFLTSILSHIGRLLRSCIHINPQDIIGSHRLISTRLVHRRLNQAQQALLSINKSLLTIHNSNSLHLAIAAESDIIRNTKELKMI